MDVDGGPQMMEPIYVHFQKKDDKWTAEQIKKIVFFMNEWSI